MASGTYDLPKRRRGPRTFWNGEPCRARRVLAIVGPVANPSHWAAGLAGTLRPAVEVVYSRETFYLDDEDGSGWAKVTEGGGSPGYGHRSLPVEQVIREIGDAPIGE